MQALKEVLRRAPHIAHPVWQSSMCDEIAGPCLRFAFRSLHTLLGQQGLKYIQRSEAMLREALTDATSDTLKCRGFAAEAAALADEKETIGVTFVDKNGEERQIRVPVGVNMLQAAHDNDIELEGACEGSLACSTCHVIIMDQNLYDKMEEPSDEENDMLDLAFGLTETSRLGCQVVASPELDGMKLRLPAATRNFYVDGHKPEPH